MLKSHTPPTQDEDTQTETGIQKHILDQQNIVTFLFLWGHLVL